MALEITHGQSAYQYRISPDDPTLIERRLNKSGQRWTWYARRDTAQEAKRVLLALKAVDE